MHPAGRVDELWRYSTTTLEWELLGGAGAEGSIRPSARRGHGMTAVGADLYVFGGSLGDGLGE